MIEFQAYPLGEYMRIEEDKIKFPEEIQIACAVCSKECGNIEFITDGSSQVCQYCGHLMYRVTIKKYVLKIEN